VIWIIAGIVIGLVAGIYAAIEEREWFDAILGIPFALFGGLMGFLVATLMGIPAGTTPYTTEYSRPLATLQDSVGVRGSFLGFNPSGTYVFYEQTSDNTYRMVVVRSSQSTVIESETEPPHVVRSDADDHLEAWRVRFGDEPKYTFYIPKGTIVMNFRLDAQ
jgi:hypothetical protein